MDELKLNKWRHDFESGALKLEIEFDAFFSNKKISDFYKLGIDDESQNLFLEIIEKEKLPQEIQKRLTDIYSDTKPEDSI